LFTSRFRSGSIILDQLRPTRDPYAAQSKVLCGPD